MKCIIADDERLVRYSIQDMLEEIADAGIVWFDEITQAVNGKDLLNQVRIGQPELVFVDIRMPQLNGLDAIEKGRTLSPHTQWIILTGYAEFDYAKRAIALGALDYLLKPASKPDIERVVQLALSHVADKRAQDQLALEHRMLGLLQDTFSEDPSLLHDVAFAGMILSLDSPLPLGAASTFLKNTMQDLRKWLRTAPAFSSTGGITLLDDGNILCVLSAPRAELLVADTRSFAVYCLDMPGNAGIVFSGQDDHGSQARGAGQGARVSFTLFPLGETRSSLTELIQAAADLSKNSSLRLAGGVGRIIDVSLRDSLVATHIENRKLFTSLDRAMRNREIEPTGLVHILKHHRYELEGCWPGSSLCQYFELYSGLDLSRCNAGMALDLCMDWCSRLLLPDVAANESGRRRQLVQRAVDIIADQYTREIGLAQVADLMGITPNYLSTEFNRVMGESFSQYVTRLRMKKADELFRMGGFTVKEVAGRVGYVSSRHFAGLFKKHFGHVPSEHSGT